MTESHQLINQDSGYTKYCTPEWIIEAARKTMGYIELDPASSEYANNNFVRAKRYYSSSGLIMSWEADTVWLNHPYSRRYNKAWIKKAVDEHTRGNVKQLCMICNASTSEEWFFPLYNFPMCFIHGRISFVREDGRKATSNTKGSVVVYMGKWSLTFATNFSRYGSIMFPYSANFTKGVV